MPQHTWSHTAYRCSCEIPEHSDIRRESDVDRGDSDIAIRNALTIGVTYNLAPQSTVSDRRPAGDSAGGGTSVLRLALYSASCRDDVDAYRWISPRKSVCVNRSQRLLDNGLLGSYSGQTAAARKRGQGPPNST